jgi:hypothetical protein
MISISYFISGFVPWCWIATGFASIAFSDAFRSPISARFYHRSGVLLHPGNDVAVELQNYPNVAMPQPFAGDLRMHALGEQMDCVRMT